jgi:hypothetical protein
VNDFQPNGNKVVTQYLQQELFAGQESSVAIVDTNDFERYSKTNVFAAVTPQVSPEIQMNEKDERENRSRPAVLFICPGLAATWP